MPWGCSLRYRHWGSNNNGNGILRRRAVALVALTLRSGPEAAALKDSGATLPRLWLRDQRITRHRAATA